MRLVLSAAHFLVSRYPYAGSKIVVGREVKIYAKNARGMGRETVPFLRSCRCYSRLACYIFATSLPSSTHWRHDHLIKYAYFDKMPFSTVCFYQWSRKLNYKCSLMALAIWVHLRSSNFRHVTDNWELRVKIFTLKWGKDNERATSSFRYISEAIKKVLINSPCMCVYVI